MIIFYLKDILFSIHKFSDIFILSEVSEPPFYVVWSGTDDVSDFRIEFLTKTATTTEIVMRRRIEMMIMILTKDRYSSEGFTSCSSSGEKPIRVNFDESIGKLPPSSCVFSKILTILSNTFV